MSFYPKLIGAVCGVCAAGALIYAGVSAMDKAGVSTDGILSSKPTLTVWYTEEKLEDYLSAMALEYQDAIGVRVVPVLKRSGISRGSKRRFHRRGIDAGCLPDQQ